MPTTVVFDLGGVLIDWNPRYLYRQLIDDEVEMEAFLSEVCPPSWNEEQDAGRSVAAAIEEATARHPGKVDLIRSYYERFDEMIAGAIEETVQVLDALRQQSVPCYALTNWSAETFPLAIKRFAFLDWFKGIVVSGEEKMKKPDPAIYRLLLDRYGLEANDTVFIDDSPRNVDAANRIGLHTIHFKSPTALREDLSRLQFVL